MDKEKIEKLRASGRFTDEEIEEVKDYEINLSDKHLRFCLEYLKTYDRVESYMKVYGVSRRSAYTSSKLLMQRPDVQAFIDAENRYLIKQTRETINSHRVIREISKLAFEDTYEHRQTKITALKLLTKTLGLDEDGSLDRVTQKELGHLFVRENKNKVEAKKLEKKTNEAKRNKVGRPKKADKL